MHRYNLTEKDRTTLKDTINTVKTWKRGVPGIKPPIHKNSFKYANITEDLSDGFYSAVEIRFLSDGQTENITDGIEWGENLPLRITGGVNVGDVVRVEPFYMVDIDEDKQVNMWVGSAVGAGGTGLQRLRINSSASLDRDIVIQTGATIIDDYNVDVGGDVDIVQNKFQHCTIYSGEIFYATIREDGVYMLDINLTGVDDA